MNKLNEVLEYIISTDKELKAIDVLLKSHNEKHKKLYNDCRSFKNSLKAIHKINASDNKDKKSAIEVLSEL